VLYWQFWVSFWKGWADIALKDKKEGSLLEGSAPAPGEKFAYLAPCPLQPKPDSQASEFLAHMNHDLRTPLNAVIGFAQIIESEMYGQINPQYLEYARHIQESGYDLLAKIENLLYLAEAERPVEPKRTRPKLIRKAAELALAE
jgi:signal transduction histidine kinase